MSTIAKKVLAAAMALALTAVAGAAAGHTAPPAAKAASARHTVKPARFNIAGMPASAERYYSIAYGVDQLSAKLAESGQLVRVSYRVTDIARASSIHDRAASPYLLDEKIHAVLQVPVMEKVGPLRQSVAPEYGKAYWMAFSNKGNVVKAGHRVSVVIGAVRIDGLVVQP